MEEEKTYFSQLTDAGRQVIQGNYRAAAHIFDLTREGRCPPEVGELAEMLGLMTVKVEAREHGLQKALAEVKKKNEELEKAAKLRAEFGMIFSGIVILLSFYMAALSYVQDVMKVSLGPLAFSTQLMNLGLCVAVAVMMAVFLRKHRYPAANFGLTWKNWQRSVLESLLACIPAVAALTLFKLYLIHSDPAYAGRPLIEWSDKDPWMFFVLYIWVTFFQEMSYRGFQQTCIERLLTGKRRTLIAILLSSVQFGVVHLHYSFRLGMMSFLGAALFGLLYARHRTIVGITVAHYVLGQIIFGPLRLIQ